MTAVITAPTPAGGVLEGTYPDPSGFSPDGEALILALVGGGGGGGDHPDSDHAGLVAADAALDARLDTIEAIGPLASAASVTTEAGTRAAADTALTTAVNLRALASDLTAEITRATTQEGLKLAKTANLSDLPNATTARTNLGLGSAAVANSGDFDASGAAAAAQAAAVQRGNHTGVQAQSTVTGLVADLAAKADLVGGLVPVAQLPSTVISDTFIVASQAAMLALTAQRGDVAIRSDLSKTFILATDSPGTLADWKELLSPADAVASVNGRVGAVTGLAENVDLTGEISRATAAELLLAPLASPPLTGNPTAPTQTAGNSTTRLATTAFVQTAASAKVADAITDAVTDVAPSQNAVFDALAGKSATGHVHGASAITFVPAGTIAATNVQAAIEEVAAEAGSGGLRVEDEGSTVVAAATGVNFAGAGVTVTDAGSNEALVTIPGQTADSTKVDKATLDANSVLYAVTDDTPAALAMAASTILARLAAGNIVAATPAQLKTLLAIASGDVSGLGTAATANKVAAGVTGVLDATDATTTNTRTPADASVTPAKFAASAIDPSAATAGARTLGTGAAQATAGNDSRLSDTRTPTNATVTPPKMALTVALTDGANIATDASLAEIFSVTIAGNRTIDNPTNPTAGQTLIYRIKQDATGGRTITWGSEFRGGTDVPLPTLTVTAAKTDYVGFKRNTTDTKWDCLAVSRGY